MDILAYKWHNEKHDIPKLYKDIIVQTLDGLLIEGCLSDIHKFMPKDKTLLSKVSKVTCKRWRYKH